jgi:cytochrome b6-f complex iron-sulfur subunit
MTLPNDSCASQCPLAHAVDRRTFVSRSLLAAAAAALAACSAGSDGPTTPTSIGGATVKISDYPALATTGGLALVTVSGTPLAIVRTDTSTFVALSRVCPHEGGIVNSATGGFTCPVHGAHFSTTGTWLSGQRTSSLRSYATTYDAATQTLTIA